jgi:hypothetical protein
MKRSFWLLTFWIGEYTPDENVAFIFRNEPIAGGYMVTTQVGRL